MPDTFNNERVRVTQMVNMPCLFLYEGLPCPLGEVCPCAHNNWERHVLLHPDHRHSHMAEYQRAVCEAFSEEKPLSSEANEGGEVETAPVTVSTVSISRSSDDPLQGQRRLARVAQICPLACFFFCQGLSCPLGDECPCAHGEWELQAMLRPNCSNTRRAEYQQLVMQCLGIESCNSEEDDDEDEKWEEGNALSHVETQPPSPFQVPSLGDGFVRVAQMTNLPCWFSEIGMPCALGQQCPRAHNAWECQAPLRPDRCNHREQEYQENVHSFLGIKPCTAEEAEEEEEEETPLFS